MYFTIDGNPKDAFFLFVNLILVGLAIPIFSRVKMPPRLNLQLAHLRTFVKIIL